MEEITWDSSNDDVATISKDGLLTIKEKGKVKITVQRNKGQKDL